MNVNPIQHRETPRVHVVRGRPHVPSDDTFDPTTYGDPSIGSRNAQIPRDGGRNSFRPVPHLPIAVALHSRRLEQPMRLRTLRRTTGLRQPHLLRRTTSLDTQKLPRRHIFPVRPHRPESTDSTVAQRLDTLNWPRSSDSPALFGLARFAIGTAANASGGRGGRPRTSPPPTCGARPYARTLPRSSRDAICLQPTNLDDETVVGLISAMPARCRGSMPADAYRSSEPSRGPRRAGLRCSELTAGL